MIPASAQLWVLFASIAAAAGTWLTVLVRDYLTRRAVLDHPNGRSSHAAPVPRGGGLAVMLVVTIGIILITAFAPWPPLPTSLDEISFVFPRESLLLIPTLLLMLVSWIDDRRGVRVSLRLITHLLAATVGCLAFTPEQTLFGGFLPFWADRLVIIGAWTWFMNLYNFMDGIDGLTGVETLCLAAGATLIFSAAHLDPFFASLLAALLAGASIGFLALNWHPAKLFLGDVGSVPLGFLTGYLLLLLAMQGQPVAALILPLYYLADSGFTLLKRAARREKIWQAHRQHFYQRAALKLGRHDRVVLWVLIGNLALIDAALLSTLAPLPGLWIAVIVVAILLGTMHKAPQS